jgi:hypothetical protein
MDASCYSYELSDRHFFAPYIDNIFILCHGRSLYDFYGSLGSGFGEMKKVALNSSAADSDIIYSSHMDAACSFGVGKLLYAGSPIL